MASAAVVVGFRLPPIARIKSLRRALGARFFACLLAVLKVGRGRLLLVWIGNLSIGWLRTVFESVVKRKKHVDRAGDATWRVGALEYFDELPGGTNRKP